jgi:fatty-acyl-CoA synthase
MMHAILGGTLVVMNDFNPSRAIELIERHQVQVIPAVPLIFESMARAPEFRQADLSSVKTALVGGAPVPVPLLEAWGAKGVALRQLYGMTEIGGLATATLPWEAAAHPDSCGIGSIFTEVKVVRPNGEECGPGESGEVILRGPAMTPGYWGDPETTSKAIRDGWLYSGDLGVKDAEGRLRFLDRLKELIISGGINISPAEIEQVIAAVEGVVEVVVIPAVDEKFGETPAAIVTVDQDVSEEQVLAACKGQLADYKLPRYIVIRHEPLPRQPSGKLDKREIRAAYADVASRYTKVR